MTSILFISVSRWRSIDNQQVNVAGNGDRAEVISFIICIGVLGIYKPYSKDTMTNGGLYLSRPILVVLNCQRVCLENPSTPQRINQ